MQFNDIVKQEIEDKTSYSALDFRRFGHKWLP